jgi:hypothetical protein
MSPDWTAGPPAGYTKRMRIRNFPSWSSTRVTRALATVILGFQALLWGGGSIIEARAAAEALSRYSHFEDQGTTACLPIHSHLDCLICRTMSGGGTGGSAPSFIPMAAGVAETPVSQVVAPADRRFCGTLGSRAPPGAIADRGPIA